MQNKVKEVKSYTLLPGIDTLYFFINCDTELYHKFYILVNSGDWQKFENYSFQYKILRNLGFCDFWSYLWIRKLIFANLIF